ncbi:MAG: hypothetical protein ACLFNU_09995 [Bacteroidales bacterium]
MRELENKETSFLPDGRKAPFVAPSGYFDELPRRIQERCIAEKPINESKKAPLIQVLKSQLALASGFIGLALLAFLGYYNLKPTDKTTIQLSNDDYIEIVSRNIYDFDETTLMERAGYNSSNHPDDSLNEEMIQYLLDEDIDYTTLIEQY